MCGDEQTAAIHFRWQHLGWKILQGPHPVAWDFLLLGKNVMLTGVYKKPYTFYHAPSHKLSNHNQCQCTIHLHAMHLSTT